MNKKLITNLFAALALAFVPSLTIADDNDDKAKERGEKDQRAIFEAMDANDDNKISIKELGDSKRFKNANKQEVAKAFKARDLNDDGEISFHEFKDQFSRDRRKKGGKGKGKKGGKGKGGKGGKGGGK